MMVIIGAPSLIAAVTQEKDRGFALGAWGAFMPGGIALATWLAPSVMAHAGWRGLWAWGAAVLLVFAVIFEALTPPGKGSGRGNTKEAFDPRHPRRPGQSRGGQPRPDLWMLHASAPRNHGPVSELF